MATSSLAIERRFRRRRQIAVFLTLAVVVAVIALAVRYRTEERETAEYLALVDEIAAEELAVAESLQDMFGSLGNLDRPAIVERLDTLSGRAAELDTRLGEAVVTRPAAALHGFAAVAVRSWSEGLGTLGAAAETVMNLGEEAVAQESPLLDSFDQLRLGDQAYAAFLAEAAGFDTEANLPEFPDVSFVSGSQPQQLEEVWNRLRLTRNLQEKRDVSVTANTAPEPTGDQNGVLVMPYTAQFDVTAVVTNRGNVVQEAIEVTLQLARDGADGGGFEEQRIIPALDPDGAASLEFVGIPIEPGALYTMQVTASITDDADVENNIWEVLFATNSE